MTEKGIRPSSVRSHEQCSGPLCYVPPKVHVSSLPSVSKTNYFKTHHSTVISVRAVVFMRPGYHRLGELNNRRLFFQVLEATSLREGSSQFGFR